MWQSLMNKPADKRKPTRRLADVVGPCLTAAFKRHGFASTEIVTHWETIVGAEVAAHAEPLKITWPRQSDPDDPEPATLVLRCEGPAALEIQHQANVIVGRDPRSNFDFTGRLAIERDIKPFGYFSHIR